MKRPVLQPLFAWAIRDLMRRPLESGLLVTALLLTVSVTAAPLLFTQALSTTTDRMLKEAPSLIVRKFNALGWTPIPSDQSAQLAKSVPGVIAARPRVWGRVAGPEGPLTVIGVDRGGSAFAAIDRRTRARRGCGRYRCKRGPRGAVFNPHRPEDGETQGRRTQRCDDRHRRTEYRAAAHR